MAVKLYIGNGACCVMGVQRKFENLNGEFKCLINSQQYSKML